MDRTQFYSNVLLYIGFRLKDFKMGNDEIFFQSNKFHLLEKFFYDVAENKEKMSEEEENKNFESTLSVTDPLILKKRRKPK